MTTSLHQIDNDEKRDQLLKVLPKVFTQLTPLEQQISIGIYQQLAKGIPVDHHELAGILGLSSGDVEGIIDEWTGIYRDEQQRIIGYWGLALNDMPNRMIIDNRTLYAWCAWDSLFIPPLLEKTGAARNQSQPR